MSETAEVIVGDCLAVMPTLGVESVDAIVTDPPYHLTTGKKGGSGVASLNPNSPAGRARVGTGFMGKAWDGGDVAFRVETWAAALRVAKPGAHLVAFGGTRTFHRLTCAIEDAGWEIRDCLSWLYGSGFPKSLDISKAIDKAAGRIGHSVVAIKRKIRAAHDASGRTLAELNAACGFEASGYLRESSTWATVLPPADKWPTLRDVLGMGREWDAVFAEAEREVIGQSRSGLHRGSGDTVAFGVGNGTASVSVTAPATDAANQWEGWGTALKPAWEPIILARKPLVGTVAANVQAHGTGGLNIDATRIGGEFLSTGGPPGFTADKGWHDNSMKQMPPRVVSGRWPANVCLDEDAARLLDEQSGQLQTHPGTAQSDHREGTFGIGTRKGTVLSTGDAGGASRFFYTAKASRAERNAGLDGMPKRRSVDSDWVAENRKGATSGGVTSAQSNHHPTVKPIKLMRWLVRLVTPPGGVVLDPFTGSGSTGCAALAEGVRFVGIERESDYVDIARARLAHAEAALAAARASQPDGAEQLGLL